MNSSTEAETKSMETESKKTLGGTIAALWKARDELHIRNIRLSSWSALALVPLAMIITDIRLLWVDYSFLEIDSGTLMIMSFGLGMLLVALLPQKALPYAVKTGAVLAVVLLILQLVFDASASPGAMTALFCLYQAASALCMAGAYYVFFFRLRNVERLLAMVICELYYVIVNDFLWNIKSFENFIEHQGALVFVALFCVALFFGHKDNFTPVPAKNPQEERGGYSVFILDIIYLIMGYMWVYLQFESDIMDENVFGTGSFVAVACVIIIQLVFNKGANHMWSLFLMLAVLSMAALLIDNVFFVNAGSFLYGVSDGIGYIAVMYILGGAARHNNSYRFFRFAAFIFFIEQFVLVRGIDYAFASIDANVNYIVFGITIVCVIVGVMTIPLLTKHLFMSDWSDSFHSIDMTVYAQEAEQVDEIDKLSQLNLTTREREIFVLLLSGMLLKQIAGELSISYPTVNFHTKNLYKKLDVQGRSELSAKFHNLV